MTPLLGVVAIIALGYGVLWAIRIRPAFLEALSLGWLVGSGLVTSILFWFGIMGWWASLYLILLPLFTRHIPLNCSMPGHSPVKEAMGGEQAIKAGILPSKILLLFWILIGIQILIAFVHIYWLPTIYWDAFDFWHLKAKFFLEEGSLGLNGDTLWMLGGRKNHYPLHMPILKALICYLKGGWSDPWALGMDLLSFCSLLVLAYRWLSFTSGRDAATTAVYIITSVPIVEIHLCAGYSDLMVAIYLASSALSWDKWRRGFGHQYLVLSAILLAFGAWTKNDVIALYLPIFLIATYMTERWKGLITFLTAVLLLLLPWISFKYFMGLGYAPNPGEAYVQFHPEALILILKALFFYGSFGVFWFFFFAVLFLKPLKQDFSGLLLLGIGCFAAVLAVFTFTPVFKFLANNMTFQRLLLQVFPLLVIGYTSKVFNILSAHKMKR